MKHFGEPGTDTYFHVPIFRNGETNHCPGCGQVQWYIGRITAECPFCATALPLQHTGFEGMGLGATYWQRDVLRHGWNVGPHSRHAAGLESEWNSI